MNRLSIIIPALNEADNIVATLLALAPLAARGAQRIVVDGGSTDDTVQRARAHAERVIVTARGRASQMNGGAAAAGGDALLFLHADTRLPANADRLISDALASHQWGRFDIRIDEPGAWPALVAWFMNWRSRLSGIATGDQAMFMRRNAFERLGGFAAIPLMEDIEMSRRLKALGPPACLEAAVVTSGRRWVRHGPLRTIWLMWRLRAAYFFGADPARLASRYTDAR
ncbi:MAG: TIGR04283 family arsenosugar biosynthesis glycosyltransferase [Sterolibacteriaceae bacterium]|uniref:TIGR04283 family arsenosugar biosynthesis glycosyltransferase n=1 Tax=Candidatus Methylophosphatis roskildensis TaxID=2899263 RepID=A0A9D7E5S7_9PROT|nr:TIGR04283 family arsenosugar biosynthesis glycosyltransferase [Candidatus Methylophosphatis roskildensis]MBK7236873.1 TIGR04283 family arsenosugar biosynthesis glycosyltransferase [Sterolibacteriaceae bacterium]